MIGRKVRTIAWHGAREGTVTAWQPLGAGLCDARVTFADGSVCWYASRELYPIDDKGPLPTREDAQEKARIDSLTIK